MKVVLLNGMSDEEIFFRKIGLIFGLRIGSKLLEFPVFDDSASKHFKIYCRENLSKFCHPMIRLANSANTRT